jgi:predicted enzyme related to lactoylglutathione lyase
MATKDSYAQGIPNWLDLSTPDAETSKTFYGKLFNWDFLDLPAPDGGTYTMAQIDGKNAAGMMQQSDDNIAQGMPAGWSMYIAVDDVDASTKAAEANGGKVLAPAMDIPGSGRMSFVIDPVGAAVGLWQAEGHIGAQVVNQHGGFTWSEVVTDNPDALNAFYGPVTGAEFKEIDFTGPYTGMAVGDSIVGGTIKPPMEGIPPHWHVYFQVDDCDGAVATAQASGGELVNGPIDTPAGRLAVLRDPHGGMFSVLTPLAQ